MNLADILQIVSSLEQSGALVEGVTEAVADKIQKQEGGFLPMLLGSLAAVYCPKMLGKRAGEVREGFWVP